jgi:sigma-E factor negative regulatory protein RseB
MNAAVSHNNAAHPDGWTALCRRLPQCLLLSLSCWTHAGAATTEPATPTTAASRLDASAVIRRIQDAANRHSFTGTFVVSWVGAVTSLRITHVGDGQNQIERVEALDGQMRQIYRHNDLVHVLWPRSHAASIEHRDLGRGYPAALQSGTATRLDMYELQPAGLERVAGFEADVLLLRPRDAQRYGQRLWLEHQTGLLLRTDILGPHGELIETSGFSDLQWGTKSPPQTLLAQMHDLKGYRIERPKLTHTELEREGWTLRAPVAGFRVLHTYVHPPGLPLHGKLAPESLRTGSGHPPVHQDGVLQAVYSDGLTTVSLFIERYDASRHQREAPAVSHGATQALGMRHGDWWITAVGDVPRATLQQFAAQIERHKP